MIGIPAGIGIVLVMLQSPPQLAKTGRGVFSQARLIAVTASLVNESIPAPASLVRSRKPGGRDMAIAGGVLMASGITMIAVNSAGLAAGTTIPPGGERDGYLGKPGVVIGGALVITGIVLIVRSHGP